MSDEVISQSSGEKYQKELEIYQSRFTQPKKSKGTTFHTTTTRSQSVTEKKVPSSLPYAMAREELFVNEVEHKKMKRVGGRNIGQTMRLKAAAENLKENRMDQIRKEMKAQREAKASRIDNPDG